MTEYTNEDAVGALRLAIEIADSAQSFQDVADTILSSGLCVPTPDENTGATKLLVEAIQATDGARFAVAAS